MVVLLSIVEITDCRRGLSGNEAYSCSERRELKPSEFYRNRFKKRCEG